MKIESFLRKVENHVFWRIRKTGVFDRMSDEAYLRMCWRRKFHQRLNLENPQTYNEKLQWLKLYDRRPEYTRMVDKYEAKKYVAERIGEEYIIPTLGVWDSFDAIDFNALPDQFVLKCTHDSGGLVICRDKSKLDIEKARKKIEQSLKNNYYLSGREWPYKDVKPRIIAEKYMSDANQEELIDYKLICCRGEVKSTLVCKGRQTKDGLHITFYDADWNLIPAERGHPRDREPIARPKTYEQMRELARILSEDIPVIRVDFYEVNGRIYFGELTFYPASGMTPFDPPEWDKTFGDWIVLPKKK